MGQLVSPRWVAAREDILARGKAEPQIWYEQFAAICQQHGLTEPETSTLAKLMHDLGLIIYYSDDEGLRDIVVLNPEWLTKAISYVLEDEATRQAGGHPGPRAAQADLARPRRGYDPRYHPYFLRLMEKFDISYRIEGDETHSLVAQLVPLQRPSLPWQQAQRAPSGNPDADADLPDVRARARPDPMADRPPSPRLHRHLLAARGLPPPPDRRLRAPRPCSSSAAARNWPSRSARPPRTCTSTCCATASKT